MSQDGALRVSLTTWNLGYGGLGAQSDFVADGGKRWLPPSRKGVRNNVSGIAAWLSDAQADILLLQEVAGADPTNLWVNLRKPIRRLMRGRMVAQYTDLGSRWLPPPFSLAHGLEVYSRQAMSSQEVWPLPSDGDLPSGITWKAYGALVARINLPGAKRPLCAINIHLAAFDVDCGLRRRQLAEILRRASLEHEGGCDVIIGGDWNLRLCATDFPHNSRPEDLWWLGDLNREDISAGWSVACDPTTPSVRTNERPYVAGQNYTTIIDGFIVSPGIETVRVETADLGFAVSDHHPVTGYFRLPD
jgi:endonuclease/exonuclease/phosphatase family metal-dependent hydrolase